MRKYRPVKFVVSFVTLQDVCRAIFLPPIFVIALIATFETWLISAEHITPLSMSPFTVLGVVIGLLLTFRTNTSYDRFWEGRKAWGTIVNCSRDLARQLASFDIDDQTRTSMIEDLLKFSSRLKKLLQNRSVSSAHDSDSRGATSQTPTSADVCEPLVQFSTTLIKLRNKGNIDSHQLQLLDNNLSILIDQQGVCERIQNTPMPIAYVLYLRSFIFAYCLALPFGLVVEVGWATPLVIALVALSFFSIDRIGGVLEDPFKKNQSSIDLEGILTVIRRDTLSIGNQT